VATHELDRLQKTPEIAKVRALLKAAKVQVNQLCNDQAPSYSIAPARSLPVYGLTASRRSYMHLQRGHVRQRCPCLPLTVDNYFKLSKKLE
jgi:hypothetical protein